MPSGQTQEMNPEEIHLFRPLFHHVFFLTIQEKLEVLSKIGHILMIYWGVGKW